MKTILTLIIVGAVSLNSQASTNAMLRGIRIVETQDQAHPPRGKLGERGPYQFRRATWRMHTKSSFDLAENREVANNVAKRHYAWIEAQLKASGLEPSPHNVAMAWNAGVNAVIRGRVPAVARDYATRVINLAGTFADEAPTAEPAVAIAEVPPTTTKTWAPALLVLDDPSTTDPTAIVSLPGPLTLALATPTEALTQPTEASAAEEPAIESPVTVAAAETVLADEDQHAVRFHTDPIMLAFSRNEDSVTTGEPVSATTTTAAQTEFPLDAVLVANASPSVNQAAQFELRIN